jgi:hypothetical protein
MVEFISENPQDSEISRDSLFLPSLSLNGQLRHLSVGDTP